MTGDPLKLKQDKKAKKTDRRPAPIPPFRMIIPEEGYRLGQPEEPWPASLRQKLLGIGQKTVENLYAKADAKRKETGSTVLEPWERREFEKHRKHIPEMMKDSPWGKAILKPQDVMDFPQQDLTADFDFSGGEMEARGDQRTAEYVEPELSAEKWRTTPAVDDWMLRRREWKMHARYGTLDPGAWEHAKALQNDLVRISQTGTEMAIQGFVDFMTGTENAVRYVAGKGLEAIDQNTEITIPKALMDEVTDYRGQIDAGAMMWAAGKAMADGKIVMTDEFFEARRKFYEEAQIQKQGEAEMNRVLDEDRPAMRSALAISQGVGFAAQLVGGPMAMGAKGAEMLLGKAGALWTTKQLLKISERSGTPLNVIEEMMRRGTLAAVVPQAMLKNERFRSMLLQAGNRALPKWMGGGARPIGMIGGVAAETTGGVLAKSMGWGISGALGSHEDRALHGLSMALFMPAFIMGGRGVSMFGDKFLAGNLKAMRIPIEASLEGIGFTIVDFENWGDMIEAWREGDADGMAKAGEGLLGTAAGFGALRMLNAGMQRFRQWAPPSGDYSRARPLNKLFDFEIAIRDAAKKQLFEGTAKSQRGAVGDLSKDDHALQWMAANELTDGPRARAIYEKYGEVDESLSMAMLKTEGFIEPPQEGGDYTDDPYRNEILAVIGSKEEFVHEAIDDAVASGWKPRVAKDGVEFRLGGDAKLTLSNSPGGLTLTPSPRLAQLAGLETRAYHGWEAMTELRGLTQATTLSSLIVKNQALQEAGWHPTENPNVFMSAEHGLYTVWLGQPMMKPFDGKWAKADEIPPVREPGPEQEPGMGTHPLIVYTTRLIAEHEAKGNVFESAVQESMAHEIAQILSRPEEINPVSAELLVNPIWGEMLLALPPEQDRKLVDLLGRVLANEMPASAAIEEFMTEQSRVADQAAEEDLAAAEFEAKTERQKKSRETYEKKMKSKDDDDILAAIAKLGGVSKEDAEKYIGKAVADANKTRGKGSGIARIFTKKGKSLDRVAMDLDQDGWFLGSQLDPREALIEMITEALSGVTVRNPSLYDPADEMRVMEEERFQQALESGEYKETLDELDADMALEEAHKSGEIEGTEKKSEEDEFYRSTDEDVLAEEMAEKEWSEPPEEPPEEPPSGGGGDEPPDDGKPKKKRKKKKADYSLYEEALSQAHMREGAAASIRRFFTRERKNPIDKASQIAFERWRRTKRVANYEAKKFREDTERRFGETFLNDPSTGGDMLAAMQKTGNPVHDTKDSEDTYDNVRARLESWSGPKWHERLVAKVESGISGEKMDPMSPLEWIDKVARPMFKELWEEKVARGDIDAEFEQENYLTQIWAKTDKEAGGIGAYMTTNLQQVSQFVKKKVIPSYAEGMRKFGMVPKTRNVAKIVQTYIGNHGTVQANKALMMTLRNAAIPTPEELLTKKGEPMRLVMVSNSPRAKAVGYKKIDHPALRWTFKETDRILEFVVHPDAVKPLKAALHATEDSAVLRALWGIGAIAKNFELTLSGFHPIALVPESGSFAYTRGLRGRMFEIAARAIPPIAGVDALLRGRKILRNSSIVREAIQDGLIIGHDMGGTDIQYNLADEFLTKIVEGLDPNEEGLFFGQKPARSLAQFGAKSVRGVMRGISKGLWDYLHPWMKTQAWFGIKQELVRDHPDVSIGRLGQAAADFVNHAFGGINVERWDRVNKSTIRMMRGLLLSMDWTAVNVLIGSRAAAGLTVDPIRKKMGEEPIGFTNKQARRYAYATAYYMAIFGSLLQYGLLKASLDDEEEEEWIRERGGLMPWHNDSGKHFGYLAFGKDKKGRALYFPIAKQGREYFDWIEDPGQTAIRKSGPAPRMAAGLVTDIKDKGFWANPGGRMLDFLSFFVPFSQRNETLLWSAPISRGMPNSIHKAHLEDAFRAYGEGEGNIDHIGKMMQEASRNNRYSYKNATEMLRKVRGDYYREIQNAFYDEDESSIFDAISDHVLVLRRLGATRTSVLGSLSTWQEKALAKTDPAYPKWVNKKQIHAVTRMFPEESWETPESRQLLDVLGSFQDEDRLIQEGFRLQETGERDPLKVK